MPVLVEDIVIVDELLWVRSRSLDAHYACTEGQLRSKQPHVIGAANSFPKEKWQGGDDLAREENKAEAGTGKGDR